MQTIEKEIIYVELDPNAQYCILEIIDQYGGKKYKIRRTSKIGIQFVGKVSENGYSSIYAARKYCNTQNKRLENRLVSTITRIERGNKS